MTSSLSNAYLSQSAPQQIDSLDKVQRQAGVRLKLFVGQTAIGIGQSDLLDCICQKGSIALAAAQMNMDVARAESLLALTSAGFSHPLVTPDLKGDKTLELTAVGVELIQRYREHNSYIQTETAELKDWLTSQQVSR